MKKENFTIRESKFSRNIWNDLDRENLLLQNLQNLITRKN